jgi:hypothetical protein
VPPPPPSHLPALHEAGARCAPPPPPQHDAVALFFPSMPSNHNPAGPAIEAAPRAPTFPPVMRSHHHDTQEILNWEVPERLGRILEDANQVFLGPPQRLSERWVRLVLRPLHWMEWPAMPVEAAHPSAPKQQYLLAYHATNDQALVSILREGHLRPGPASEGWHGIVCVRGVSAETSAELHDGVALSLLNGFTPRSGKHVGCCVVELHMRAPKVVCHSSSSWLGDAKTRPRSWPLHPSWTITHFPRDHTPQAYSVPSALTKVSAIIFDEMAY